MTDRRLGLIMRWSRMKTRAPRAIALAALIIVCVPALVLLGVECRERHRRRRDISCTNRMRQLVVAISIYTNENGAPPYSASQAESADPYFVLGHYPKRKWDYGFCPASVGDSGTGFKDSGYRIFNWPAGKWLFALRMLCELDSDTFRVSSTAGDLAGLPVAWCSMPAHDGVGARHVALVERPPGVPSMVAALERSLPILSVPEADFQDWMGRVARVMNKYRMEASREGSVPESSDSAGD